MRAHTPFLLQQIARFGTVGVRELLEICAHRCKKSVLYESLKELATADLIARMLHPQGAGTVFCLTDIGLNHASGERNLTFRLPRVVDVKHSLRVAESLIQLARYEYVSGFAAESELSPKEWRDFSGSRRADGVIQVVRGADKFELAIEVECAAKTDERSLDIVKQYCEAFERGCLCKGVLFICDRNDIALRYEAAIKQVDQRWSKSMMVCRGPEAPILRQDLYGWPRKTPGICAEKARSISNGVVEYFPMFSTKASEMDSPKPPYVGSQSQHEHLKENYSR